MKDSERSDHLQKQKPTKMTGLKLGELRSCNFLRGCRLNRAQGKCHSPEVLESDSGYLIFVNSE